MKKQDQSKKAFPTGKLMALNQMASKGPADIGSHYLWQMR